MESIGKEEEEKTVSVRASPSESLPMPLTKTQLTELRLLQQKKHRMEAGRFVVEGPKVVGELLASGHPFEAIYATSDWPAPEGLPVPLVRISDAEMARISHFPTPSNVLAVGAISSAPLPPGELDDGYTLALDGIQDPGNVGTLLRIADWFGFERVLLSPDCADRFSQKVINASMGSFARVRVFTGELAPLLAATPVPIYGCDLVGESIYEFDPPAAAVLVIGGEGRGLSPAVAACLDRRLTIPRHGKAESLNAAVAAGIAGAFFRRPQTARS
jgi:RNA methyltransferase, TrmH family